MCSPVSGLGSVRVFLALGAGLAGSPLPAQPTGGQVVAGSATISAGAGALTVTQTSARAIINWQDFSLAGGELARFVQPDATSATLNRVISGRPSSLMGTLEANGRVFLINSNGVLIGAQARIATAGFLASTLDVANQEFLAGGDLHFTGGSTVAVMNLGAINALGGDVFLIARQVENSGAITAANGTAGLAAGSEVLLTTGGDERLFVHAASAPGTVVNAGAITAATAELKAAGGNAYALAINNSGVVRATGSAVRNGQLWLVASGNDTVSNSGTLDASSATGQGGKVVVTGGRVLLDHDSLLEARGETGGGEILVFGSMQAGGQVAVGGTLDASATTGTGGFIETSAANVQVTDGARVTTTASGGRNGTWLIDPVDFTIAATGGDMTGAAVGTALAGGNFTIQSTTGGTGTAGDVNVNDAVSWSANKLTLNAQNNINFNAVMTGSGTASLALEYGQGAVAAGNASSYPVNAAINLPSGSNFSTKLGSDGTLKNFTVITGLGTEGSSTATDLQGMAGNLAGLYALGADLDASATSSWNASAGFAPIGTTAARYTGTFDGLGHRVSGLTIARPAQNDVGLIGYLGAGGVLKNIKLTGGSVIGLTGVGALLGSNSGSVSYASAATPVNGLKNVGGLVGSSLGPIANVWASGNVSNVSGGTGFVGGLVGNSGTGGSITNGWASGNVTATGPNAGGLVGFNSTSVISNTYATGTVSGTGFVGGLVGSVFGNINNSYATGAVTGSSSRVGGLAGHIYSGMTVSNSYATGSVAGPSLVGGFTGSSDGTVTNGYWDSTVTATGMGSGTGATGRTTAEMKALASFTGFDLSAAGGSSAIWRIYEGNTTPWLRVFLTPLTVTANNDTETYSGTAYSGGNGVTYSVATPNPAPSGSLTFGGTAQSALNAGTYTITTSGLFSVQQGYDISHAAGTLTINPANLTLSGTRVYDRTTLFAGSNLTATGVNGESFTVGGAGATGNLSTKNVQTGQLLASVTGLTLGSGNTGAAVAANYNGLAVTGSTVSVTPKVLTIAGFAADNKAYDGNTDAVSPTPGTLTGVVLGDTVGFTQTGATFDTKDVGAGKTVTLNGVTLTGSGDQTNYSHTATTTDLSDITVATLTYTADPTGRTYGAGDPAFTGTVGGFVPGETQLNATTGTLAFATTATVSSNVGTYAINGSGLTANSSNYGFVQAAGNATALTINPANLVLTGLRVYDGTTIFAGGNLAATGVNGETFAVTGAGAAGNLSTKNGQTGQALASVGGLTLGSSGNGGLAGNYNSLATAGSSVSVTAAPLTVSALDVVKTYDGGTTAAGTAVVTAGTLFSGDVLTSGPFGPSFAFIGKDGGIGNKTVTVSGIGVNDGNSGSNYTLTLADNTTSTINPANLVLSGTRIFDGTTIFAGGNLAATGVNGETFAVTGTGASGNLGTRNVQTGQLLASVTGLTLGSGNTGAAVATNYNNLATAGSAVSVTPKALTITADDKGKVYGAADPALTASYNGFGLGDDPSVVAGLLLSAPAGAAATAGPHTIAASGATSSNYNIAFGNGTLTVDRALLAITANPRTKIYGDADPALTYAAGVLHYTDTAASVLTGGLSRATGETVAAGPYAISQGTLVANANYTIAYGGAGLAITPRPVTLVANTPTKVYGTVDPTLGVSLTAGTLATATVTDSLADVTGTLGRQAGENTGLYDVLLGTGVKAANYAITFNADNNAFAITPAILTYVANTATRLVGQSNPAFSGTVTGFAAGDSLGSATTGAPAFGTTATISSPVGLYAINGSGLTANNGNYLFVQAPPNATAFTISALPPPPAFVPLTITADNKTKIYGAALPAFTATFAGFINGDTVANVTGLQFSTTATMGSNVGTYTVTPFGATAPAAYVIGYVPGTLTISPAMLTVTATSVTRLFGEATPAFSANFTGFVSGDTSAAVSGLTFSTAATSTPDAFTIIPLGATAANYTLVFINGTLHVVMPTVPVGTDVLPVALIDGRPALTPEFAVVEQAGHLVFVSVGGPGGVSGSPADRLALALGEATDLPALENHAAGAGGLTFGRGPGSLNLGGFELVAALPGGSIGRSGPAQPNEPGLFRESSVNMGGFNVIYHEALSEAREQTGRHTALGSSYREFSDADNPQINLVRTKIERKPGETSAGPGS